MCGTESPAPFLVSFHAMPAFSRFRGLVQGVRFWGSGVGLSAGECAQGGEYAQVPLGHLRILPHGHNLLSGCLLRLHNSSAEGSMRKWRASCAYWPQRMSLTSPSRPRVE